MTETLPSQYHNKLVTTLPLNYDAATLKTIENIDVIWLQRRSIAHAFEVEHTTAVYSGLLRMADLLALQPRIQIALFTSLPLCLAETRFAVKSCGRYFQCLKVGLWQNGARFFPMMLWRKSFNNQTCAMSVKPFLKSTRNSLTLLSTDLP